MEELKRLWKKYEEIITYLIVGGITTVISWAAMFAWNYIVYGNPMYPTRMQNYVLSTVNWAVGVIVAYFLNRRFVFKSHVPMKEEIPKFVVSRLSTLVMDIVVRQILGALGVNIIVTTVISAILVIIGNYIFSKLFVFNKK